MAEQTNTRSGEIVHVPDVIIPAAHTQVAVTQVNPRTVIANAADAARALTEAMASKTDKVMMGGKRYIEVDDWQVVARFYNCSITIVGDRFVSFGDAQGFEATAALLDRDGHEVGRATMMCLNDEDKWATRPKYEFHYCLKGTGPEDDCAKHQHAAEDEAKGRMVWIPNPNRPGKTLPKKLKVSAGVEKIPLFQLRSMAQTRAAGKVCRLNFGFVPALANYASTPAEELEHTELERDADDARDEASKSEQAGGAAAHRDNAGMTAEQQARVAEIEAKQRRNREALEQKPKAAVAAKHEPIKSEPKSEPANAGAQAGAGAQPAAAEAKAGVPVETAQAGAAAPGTVAVEGEPQQAVAEPEVVGAGVAEAVVIDFRVQSKGSTAKGPWSLYVVKFDRKVKATDGQEVESATTLDEAIANALNEAVKAGPVVLKIVPGSRKGAYNVVKVGDVAAKDHAG